MFGSTNTRGRHSPLTFLLLLFLGALAGGLAGEALSGFPGFGWIGFGGVGGYRDLVAVSLHPLIDFRSVQFGFDFALRVNAGSILGMIIGLIVFIRL